MKTKLLQEFSFYDYNEIHIEYGIHSNTYKKNELSKILKLKPLRYFNKGEIYFGKELDEESKKVKKVKKIRQFTLWVYSTENKIKVQRFENHAFYLLKRIRKVKDEIKQLLQDSENTQISIFVYLKINEKYFGLGAESELLKELLEYSNYFEFRNIK
ncbi:MAG: DUF4279 domain-containing protein [Ignavibacteriae bacterium]|nr:DUF4279 domain-containing protein [Ignavibacteriota bacterium]MBK7103689.1 DUF4279 domain-containing protein [Ignavibacteriota bacterium]MBK7103807.1 DUF4279 domain-containing protein [Ignavibacteriota bacterium]